MRNLNNDSVGEKNMLVNNWQRGSYENSYFRSFFSYGSIKEGMKTNEGYEFTVENIRTLVNSRIMFLL